MKANLAPKRKREQRRRKKPEHLPLCRLKEIREAQSKSIVQLSDESGVHRTLISRIERGIQEGSTTNHLKLIVSLDTSADEYFGLISREPLSEDKPEVLDSGSGFKVELLPTLMGSAKRIQIDSGISSNLKSFLDPEKPVFFYVMQGDVRITRNKEAIEQRAGSTASFPRAKNLSIKNISSLGAILLAIQH